MKPLISIVIPAYNAEKYIQECLHSVLNQTFQNWECVIVNDGSTDNTISIIEEFTKKDHRFRFITTINSGSSKIPRNIAISMAKADWVLTLDSDDFIDTDALQKMFERAQETNADIVYLRMKFFNNDICGEEIKHVIPSEKFDMQQIISGKEAVMLTIPKWKIGAGGALVKKSLWSSLSTFMKEVNYLNADEYDSRELLLSANKIAFADTIYYYRQYSSSISKKFTIKIFDHLHTNRMVEELINKHFGTNVPEIEIIYKYRMNTIYNLQTLYYRNCNLLSKKERKNIRLILKNDYEDLMNKANFYNRNIIKKILLAKNYNLFALTNYIISLVKK